MTLSFSFLGITRFGRSIHSTGLWAIRAIVTIFIVIGMTIRAANGAGNSFQVIKTISVDKAPFGLTLSPDGKTVWVATGQFSPAGDQLTMIDVKSLQKIPQKITVGQFPQDIAFTHLGSRAFVTNSTSCSISVIDNLDMVSQTVDLSPVPLQFPWGVAVSLDDKKIIVTTQGNSGRIAVLDNDRTAVKIAGNIPIVGESGRPAVVPSSGGNLSLSGKILIPSYANDSAVPTVTLVDPAIPSIIKALTLQGSTAVPETVVVSPDGRFAYVTLFAVGPPSAPLPAASGGLWVIDLKSFATVTVVHTGDAKVFGAGVSHNGKYIFVSNFTKNEVAVINMANNTIVATIPVGRQPNSIAVTQDDKMAFVTNQSDMTVSVISIPL